MKKAMSISPNASPKQGVPQNEETDDGDEIFLYLNQFLHEDDYGMRFALSS